MSFQKYLVGSGNAPISAQEIVGKVESGVTASGSTSQANSYGITQSHTVVTVAAANSGVRLPAGLGAGDWGTISNRTAETVFVYPPTGGDINGGSDNAKVDLATQKSALFVAQGGDNYSVIVGA